MARIVHRGFVGVVVVCAAALALSACGRASGAAKRSAASVSAADPVLSGGRVSDPDVVVVRVGGYAITKGAVAHALLQAARTEGPHAVIPVPPVFAACASRLKQVPERARLGVVALKGECGQHYQVLETRALDKLIVSRWALGAAAEAGVSVSNKEVEQVLGKYEREEGSLAKLERTLAPTHRTVADLRLQIRVQLLEEAIRKAFLRRADHLTRAQIAGYYAQHRAQFGMPVRRDLEIARAASEAAALRVKREIASGQSFASVVKKIPLPQPIFSKNALVQNYEPGMYREKPLDRAIFAAKPNVLSGPVKIFLGYYVFEVKRTYPAQQKTLAQSEATIRSELSRGLYLQGLSSFIANWRKRWTTRTSCQPGYVVAKCSEYKPAAGSAPEAEDPYTFN